MSDEFTRFDHRHGGASLGRLHAHKVIGRDAWTGIWAFALAFIAVTRWESTGVESKTQASQFWERFPKFILGFLVASILTTFIVRGYTLADYNKLVEPGLIAPITAPRT